MYYVDDILLLETGLRIAPKALLPIGIADGSLCWGLEVIHAVPMSSGNTGVAEEKEERLPHLLISAFYPTNWHILFHVVIELQDRKGVLAETSEILEAHQFNILSTQCGPAGHNHATWHIIGEALNKKTEANKALAKVIDEHFHPGMNAFDKPNRKFREMLTSEVSEKMLRYSLELENRIKAADKDLGKAEGKKHGFLHPRFADEDTLIYIGKSMDSTLRGESKELTEPVTCRWLQNLAVFRIYSQARKKPADSRGKRHAEKARIGKQVKNSGRSKASYDEPISFKYDSATALLKPAEEEDIERYNELIKEYVGSSDQLPIKAIGGFNHREHYVRIVVPEIDQMQRQISIRVPYSVRLDNKKDDHQASSIGLLKNVTKRIKDYGTNLSYISNAMTKFSKNREEGVITMVGIAEDKTIKINEAYLRGLKFRLEKIDDPIAGLGVKPIDVIPVSAERMFISTRFDWLYKTKIKLKEEIDQAAKRHGFIPVWGDPQLTSDDQSQTNSKVVAEHAINRIRTSKVFLQIIPDVVPTDKSKKDKSHELDWLNFELGVACGANIPCAVCVDKKKEGEWLPKAAYGWALFHFNCEKDSSEIIAELEVAFKKLARDAYDKVGK